MKYFYFSGFIVIGPLVVAYRILVSGPFPLDYFGFWTYWDLVAQGLGGLESIGLGLGLYNYHRSIRVWYAKYSHDIETVKWHDSSQGASYDQEQEADHHCLLAANLVPSVSNDVAPDEQADHVQSANGSLLPPIFANQVKVGDKSLCEDGNFFAVISDCFKSSLLLADHFKNQNQSIASTIGICVVEFKQDAINIQPVLLPIVPASSILKEIIASMNLLAPKIDKESGNNLQKEINPYLTVEWKDFAASLLPHIVYPAQEGYRVSLISKKNIELNGFVQQADCLAFQNVSNSIDLRISGTSTYGT